jgi:hypothetical protein
VRPSYPPPNAQRNCPGDHFDKSGDDKSGHGVFDTSPVARRVKPALLFRGALLFRAVAPTGGK